jgi:hypothetical protein
VTAISLFFAQHLECADALSLEYNPFKVVFRYALHITDAPYLDIRVDSGVFLLHSSSSRLTHTSSTISPFISFSLTAKFHFGNTSKVLSNHSSYNY